MAQIQNKFVLIVIAFLLNIIAVYDVPNVLAFLCALIFSILLDITNKKFHLFFYISYFLCSWFIPFSYCYFPLLLYDAYKRKNALWYILIFVLIGILFTYANIVQMTTLMFCLYIAIILKEKHVHSEFILETYKNQRDSTKEFTLLMQEKNNDLLLQQDYEVRLATLNERNRIAREIHDNVGHLLSSSLLQIGAICTINKNEQLQDSLTMLKSTVDRAMSSVRNSVHDLHEDALQLEIEVQKIIADFSFATVDFTYNIDSILPKDITYHILAIVKECLHNITKHSNGDYVKVHMQEHPNFYQFIIYDNGDITSQSTHTSGIGLHNIEQRIAQYHGYLNINKEHGFRVFITLPKENIT